MLKTFLDSISAGLLISIGGSVFLACDNRYCGAVFFSVALLCICLKGYYLFTGKIGYAVYSHGKKDIAALLAGLLGNLLCTFALGLLIRCAIPALGEKANAVCSAKLGLPLWSVLVRGMFCGVLMYLAVSTYKEKNTVAGILLCVPVFILSGFEHSIADMFYFGASGIWSVRIALFQIAVIIGNSAGGMILPLLSEAGGKNV